MEFLQLLATKNVAMVAHDAGGAEILSALACQHPEWQISYVLAGPALPIFQGKLGPINILGMEAALAAADWVMTGTGWQTELEWQAIRSAKALGKPVVSFLDHWVNYRTRFERNGETCLPDQLCLGDAHALQLAQQIFPELPCNLLPNPYFAEIAASFSHISVSHQGTHVLYVCEPIAEHAAKQFGNARHWGYTEFDAMAYCLQHLPRLEADIRQIVIRPHPAEAKDKYDGLLQASSLPIKVDATQTLSEEIASADIVCGCNSMALVIASLAKKKVYSCIPPTGPACNLPLPGIQMLRDLV